MTLRDFLIYKIGKFIPDRLWIQIKFFQHFHKFCNLKHPRTFNEKLQWLKLHDRKTEYCKMVDKCEAKHYVASIVGEQYIIPNYGVWDSFDEIDFNTLPEQFVLKCTHDCGGLVICRNKLNLNICEAKRKIENCLKTNYYWSSREWPYKDVKPRILAEKYMGKNFEQGLIDYKFYCFNGRVKCLYVSEGLEDQKTAKISFIKPDWQFAEFRRTDYPMHDNLPEKPHKYEEMIEIAEKLSAGHAFLRVDLYEIDNKIYFSELTFTPCSGYMPFAPEEWDYILGEWLQLG